MQQLHVESLGWCFSSFQYSFGFVLGMRAGGLADSSTLTDCGAEEVLEDFVMPPMLRKSYLDWHLHLEVGLVLRNVLLICHWLDSRLLLLHGSGKANVLCHFLLQL